MTTTDSHRLISRGTARIGAALVVAAVWMSGACESSTTQPLVQTPPVKRLVFGVTAEPTTLVPLFASSAVESELGGLLFRELVKTTAAGDVGDLAEQVPRIGQGARIDASGRLVVEWTLRKATWSDGRPVSTDDVLAGWKIALADDQPVATGRDGGDEGFGVRT